MSATSLPVAPSAPLLNPQQLMQMRDLLDACWREHVVELTDVAVELHALDDDAPVFERDAVARRLASIRRRLVDVEAALHRIQSRTYGRCDGCDRRMPFEQLELAPDTRYCHSCLSPAAGGAVR